ncbi:MAG: DUF559 domain-containing protein [Actinobacteria bacterium]|nr:DUF559 domain-containing protein [Actinomycetota bacterium]
MQNTTAFNELLVQQHLVFTRKQAREHGFNRAAIARRTKRDEWRALSPEVLVVSGSPPTELQRAHTALLDCGETAAIGLASAAALFEIPGFTFDPVHVVVPREGTARQHETALAIVHSTRRLLPGHVVGLFGVPVTTPTRTAFDLSPHVSEPRLARMVDRIWATGLTDGPHLYAMLDELRVRGRDLATMREVLKKRPVDAIPPESGLESRFMLLLEEDGQEPMDRQVNVGNDVRWLGRVDFLDRSAKVIVQIDGDAFHKALIDRDHDEAQTRALEAAGWVVLRYDSWEVWHEPRRMLAEVRWHRSIRRAA